MNRFWNMELFLEGLRIHESEIGEDSEIAGWNWEFAGQKIELNRSECVIYSEDIDSEFQRSGGLLAHIHLNGALEDRRSWKEAIATSKCHCSTMVLASAIALPCFTRDCLCQRAADGTSEARVTLRAGPPDPLIPISASIHSNQSSRAKTPLTEWGLF